MWDSSAPARMTNIRTLIVVGGVIALVTLSAFFFMGRKVSSTGMAPTAVVAAPLTVEPVLVEFEKLKGKWLRPDGGYVIEIKRLLPDNMLEAAYYNPNPIHVGKAKLYKERGFVKVFVELQDVNYPGSSYTLIYDAENDQLRGVYYQATQQQEFQIAFERLPPGS